MVRCDSGFKISEMVNISRGVPSTSLLGLSLSWLKIIMSYVCNQIRVSLAERGQ